MVNVLVKLHLWISLQTPSTPPPPPFFSLFTQSHFFSLSVSVYQIFKILVPTPHDVPLIMWGRHKNFKDLINRSWDMSKTKIWNGGFFAHPLTYWSWNTSVNDNLLISEYSSQKTEIACHPVIGMYRGELKELTWLCSQFVASDLGLAWPYKVLYLQAKKHWAQTTSSLLLILGNWYF